MNKVRIRRLTFGGHLLYLALSGLTAGGILGVLQLVFNVMKIDLPISNVFGFSIILVIGLAFCGAIVGLGIGLLSYQLINLILKGNYFVVVGSRTEDL